MRAGKNEHAFTLLKNMRTGKNENMRTGKNKKYKNW